MLWKCEVRNSYTGEDIWDEVILRGDNFLRAFKERFGKLNYRNVQLKENGKWVNLSGDNDEKNTN